MAIKRITDLTVEKHGILRELRDINDACLVEQRAKTLNESKRAIELNRTLSLIDERILELDKAEEDCKRSLDNVVYVGSEQKTNFRDWINSSARGENKDVFKIEVRANPMLTTTDSGVINKSVAPVDALYSQSEQLLKDLGIKFYTKVNGTLVLPSMEEKTAGWVSEGQDCSTADMSTTSITLNAGRVAHSQIYTVEMAENTNADVVGSILNNLYNGIWNAVAEKFFDDLDVDAATQICSNNNSTVSFTHLTNLEASVGFLTTVYSDTT